MIVLVYLVLLRELLVSTIFCMVHPYITIQLNDVYTYYTFLLCVETQLRACAR